MEEEVKVVAIAICVAGGADPEQIVSKGDESWPLWLNYRPMARQFIAAIDALEKVRGQ